MDEILHEWTRLFNAKVSECIKPPYFREKGMFVPTGLNIVDVFGELIETGSIDSTGVFVDAGSGDGRLVALVGGYFGIQSVGIEYDEALCRVARDCISQISEHFSLDPSNMKIVQGDFSILDTYSEAGLAFGDVSTFFNYQCDEISIAELIANHSVDGTRFVYRRRDFKGFVPRFSGLRHEKSLGGGIRVHVYSREGPSNGVHCVSPDLSELY